MYAPKRKSPTEAAGLSGCAGAKIRWGDVRSVIRRGLGDEAGATVWSGAIRGPN